jgi:hypothetical protein
MGWVSFLSTLLAIANTIANIIREKQLMSAGEARSLERSVAELAHRLELGRQITRRIEDLSDDDLNARLRGDK